MMYQAHSVVGAIEEPNRAGGEVGCPIETQAASIPISPLLAAPVGDLLGQWEDQLPSSCTSGCLPHLTAEEAEAPRSQMAYLRSGI